NSSGPLPFDLAIRQHFLQCGHAGIGGLRADVKSLQLGRPLQVSQGDVRGCRLVEMDVRQCFQILQTAETGISHLSSAQVESLQRTQSSNMGHPLIIERCVGDAEVREILKTRGSRKAGPSDLCSRQIQVVEIRKSPQLVESRI